MQGGDGVSIELGPTWLQVFDNPKPGSHFFGGRQTAGIELPMKALALEDTGDKCAPTCNDPQHVSDRHGICDRTVIVQRINTALDSPTRV